MPYDKNEPEYSGGPKKADIIIKNTHDLAVRQQELAEQTKLALSKIEDIINLFNQSNADSSDAANRNGELFTQLQGENSALKQELLYLAKQSENIYAGLAEKITELSDQAKVREDAMTGFADRLNDVAEQTRKSEESCSIIADKLTELAEHSKRSTELYNELSNRLDVISTFTSGAYVPTSERVESKVDLSEILNKIEALSAKVENVQRVEQQPVVLQTGQPAIVDLSQVMTRLDNLSDQMKKNERAPRSDYSDADMGEIFDKLSRISEQLRRGESAHSMLADKFEILSMRVDQYAYDSKGMPSYRPQPQVVPAPAPAPVQTVVKEEKELDYDKLAQKVADLISSREAVSPDYIASKVAEQIIIPEVDIPSLNVSMDADYIASKVAEKIVLPEAAPAAVESVQAPALDEEILVEKIAKRISELQPEVTIDGDELAEKITQRVAELMPAEEVQASADIDSDELAQKIAERLNLTEAQKELAPASAVDINEETLAEKLAGKLGVYTAQALAPAVSVSSGIDEEALAQRIADKLSSVRTSAYDVDEEELADAISIKVGSLKAEDFEILVDDEGCTSISKGIADNLDYNMISNIISDKLREALDLAAVNAPDYEEMAERISEKITVAGINEDAIADKAAAVLSNYLPEFDTDEIADKITGAVIDVVSAIPTPTVDSDGICNTITERLIESQEDHDYDIVIDDDGIARITELVSEEITKDTGARFDKVEENIAKLSEMLSRIDENTTAEEKPETEEDPLADVVSRLDAIDENVNKISELLEAPEETDDEQYDETEDDYDAISEMVTRLDGIEENITKLTELLETPEEEEYEETEEEEVEETEEEQAPDLTETVVTEIEKVGTRLAGVEENIAKIAEYLASETQDPELDEAQDEEEDYTSEVVSRLEGIEENVAKLTELLTPEEVEEEQVEEAEEDGYDALSEVVTRLDGIEENITKLNELLTSEEYAEEEYAEEDYTVLSETVAGEVEKRISGRLDGMEERISTITEVVRSGAEEEASQLSETKLTNLSLVVAAEVQRGINQKLDNIETSINAGHSEEAYTALSEAVANEVEKRVAPRFDAVEEGVAKINEAVTPEEVEAEDEEEYVEEEVDYTALSEAVANEVEKRVGSRLEGLEESVAKINEAITAEPEYEEGEEEYAEEVEEIDFTALSEAVANEVEKRVDSRLAGVEEKVSAILANGVALTEAVAAVQSAEAEDLSEEEPLVTVSDIVDDETEEELEEVQEVEETAPLKAETKAPLKSGKQLPEEEEFEEEEEEPDDEDFLIDVLDMDAFSDDELMPGEGSEFRDGVDFENMMKFKRSFIARIIQSNDDYKQYYGEVKHALLSYRKVNSNVAWGAERFNKGRETIARMKIRGKTLCLYLALDPNEYKTSVYHHLDVSDNKSVAGTPMLVKVKSNLGVRKAIRLIDEMLSKRNGEKKEIPERDYAAMYPYETIEELIEDGLVKDVRKK